MLVMVPEMTIFLVTASSTVLVMVPGTILALVAFHLTALVIRTCHANGSCDNSVDNGACLL